MGRCALGECVQTLPERNHTFSLYHVGGNPYIERERAAPLCPLPQRPGCWGGRPDDPTRACMSRAETTFLPEAESAAVQVRGLQRLTYPLLGSSRAAVSKMSFWWLGLVSFSERWPRGAPCPCDVRRLPGVLHSVVPGGGPSPRVTEPAGRGGAGG